MPCRHRQPLAAQNRALLTQLHGAAKSTTGPTEHDRGSVIWWRSIKDQPWPACLNSIDQQRCTLVINLQHLPAVCQRQAFRPGDPPSCTSAVSPNLALHQCAGLHLLCAAWATARAWVQCDTACRPAELEMDARRVCKSPWLQIMAPEIGGL